MIILNADAPAVAFRRIRHHELQFVDHTGRRISPFSLLLIAIGQIEVDGNRSFQRRPGFRQHGCRDAYYHPDPVILRIGDIEIARIIHENTSRVKQTCLGGRSPISGKTTLAIARYCSDNTRRIHLSDPIILLIGEEEIAGPIDRNPNRLLKTRFGGRPSISRIPPLPISSHRSDNAQRIHLPNPIIAPIGNIEIADPIDRYSIRIIQTRTRRQPAIT